MSSWDDLSAELNAWAAAGRIAEFWWRDDDAVSATPALDRLLTLRAELAIPVAVAVIPARAEPSLAEALRGEGDVDVLQHGFAHVTHRGGDRKKAELGADRDLWDIARELADGRGRMTTLFDARWLDVMVPPWNRIDPQVSAILPGLGFHGLSTFRARSPDTGSAGLTVVNTHVDLIDWAHSRAYAGDDAVVGAAIAHLAAKRNGAADPAEATGVLSHHLAHDDGCWDFLARFGRITSDHPAVQWRRAEDMFPVAA